MIMLIKSFMRKLIECNLECDDIKKYLDMNCIKCTIESMSIDYKNLDLKNRKLLKYRIEHILNDQEDTNSIGNLLTIATSLLIAQLATKDIFIGIMIFLLLLFYTVYIAEHNKYIRACKLFLTVIRDIDLEKNS